MEIPKLLQTIPKENSEPLQTNLRKIHLFPALFTSAVKINIVAFDGTVEA